MLESEAVTSETSVDPKELKELIARLPSPSGNTPDGSVRIKDIAETLEVKEDDVIRQLTLLRAKKNDEIMAQQARNQLQYPAFARRTVPQQRLVFAVLFFALFLGFLMFFFLIQPPTITPTSEPPVKVAPALKTTTQPVETKTP